MAYRFKPGDPSVEKGLRRIALDQIGKAVSDIDTLPPDLETAIHQVRKRCKKLRGLIRLVRPAFADYARENAGFRDIARGLSGPRDRAVMVATYDALVEHYAEQVDRPALASIRRRLTLRLKAAEAEGGLDRKLSAARAALVDARDRAATWRLDDDGFAALSGGLAKTYGRARDAMAAAASSGAARDLHEWRKRVKYHWYHARLLAPVWPGHLGGHAEAAHRLGDLLGRHHDLAVFQAELGDDPAAFGDAADVAVMMGLAQTRQRELAAEAFALGGRLLTEKPKRLAGRWGGYWALWSAEVAEGSPALAA